MADVAGFAARKADVGASAASSAASATRATSRRAASRRRTSPARSARAPGCSRRARCASTRPAASPSSPARTATARATRRRSRRSSPTRLGIPVDNVEIVHGDTGRDAVRHGHLRLRARSRSAARRSSRRSTRSIAKGKKIAAHLLEAADSRHRVRGRRVHGRRHRQEAMPSAQRRAHRLRAAQLSRSTSSSPGLNENAFYDPTNFTYPGRQLHLRGRGRPRHRRRARSISFSRGATTSATSSTR